LTIGNNNKRQLERGLNFVIDGNRTTKIGKCQLDTGATCNVIGLNNLCELMEQNNPAIQPTSVKIWGFGDGITVPLVKAKVECWRNNRHYDIIFQVVDCDHIPLLSWEKFEELNLIKVCPEVEEIKQIKTSDAPSESLIQKFQEVWNGLRAKLTLN
jgi:hypothetical protein